MPSTSDNDTFFPEKSLVNLMAGGAKRWLETAWRAADDVLLSLSKKAQSILRRFMVVRVMAIVFMLMLIAVAVLAVLFPPALPYIVAGLVVASTIPMFLVFLLAGIPFRNRSLVRLIRMGYPANARELAIRAAARKMHEESIETEELLVETAWNESKKALKKYRTRLEKLRDQLDALDEPDDQR